MAWDKNGGEKKDNPKLDPTRWNNFNTLGLSVLVRTRGILLRTRVPSRTPPLLSHTTPEQRNEREERREMDELGIKHKMFQVNGINC